MVSVDTTGFEKAIKKSPDDKALKLVYADFLEENGSIAEAEFQRWVARTGWELFFDASSKLYGLFNEEAETHPIGREYGDVPKSLYILIDDHIRSNKIKAECKYGFSMWFNTQKRCWDVMKNVWVMAYSQGWRSKD